MNLIFRPQRPFWPVTLLSGLLALLTSLALLIIQGQTGQWQYLALAAIVAVVFVAHGVAWWLAYQSDRFTVAIWLIATAQILAAVVAPLLVSDFWFIGLFMLAVVPLEVGLADQLHRILPFTVIALLGAAVMLTVDLLMRAPRPALLADLPGGILLPGSLALLHIAGMSLLLWRFRLRPGASHRFRLDLATQQGLVYATISALSILLVTGVLIVQIRASQIEQVGHNFQALAEINAERVGNTLEQQIDVLLALGRRETVLHEGLAVANNSYPDSREEALRLLQERELLWQTLPDTSDFVLQYRSNPQTIQLSRFRGSDLLHNNVFLTDRLGGLVAAQGEKPPHFAFGDQLWWQTAWNHGQGGIYLGDLSFDSDDETTSIFIAIGVLNPQTNQTVGVLASTYQLRAIQNDIRHIQTLRGGRITLLAPDGVIIAGPEALPIGHVAWPELFAAGPFSSSGDDNPLPTQEPVFMQSGWFLGPDFTNQPAVVAYAPLNTTSGVKLDILRALNWQIAVSDTQANALAGVTRSTQVTSLVGVFVMAFVVLAAIYTARVITRPIEALTQAATAISEGALEQYANPVGPVELVTLAEAFNTLATRLRSLVSSLQEQVVQRTAQLEARVEQMATLNRITQTVSSVHELEAALELVAREMVYLFQARNSGIALLNAKRTELTVVADCSRYSNAPSTVGTIIPLLGNASSLQVVESGRSIVVPKPQTNPLTETIHDLMRTRRTECLMLIPLLARGEVIGTIGVATEEEGRVFTEAEVNLAETIAGQVASAIESARLFSEMEKAKETAEAANETKSAFLANVSHELRTPLTSVLGFAKIIQRQLQERIFPVVQTEDSKTRRAIQRVSEDIQIIITEGERLTTLINSVLDLAKIEAGKVEWHMQPLSVGQVIEQATAATAVLFTQKEEVTLIKEVDAGLPEIIGDHDRLIQVVINLISNAVKFTEQGAVTCQAYHHNGEIVVRVRDTGIGIADEDQPRVFEKFTQVSDTLTGKPHGTGLGLPICKEIVEYHGGRIWVESKVGQGSTFSLTLPVPVKPGNSHEYVTMKEGEQPAVNR